MKAAALRPPIQGRSLNIRAGGGVYHHFAYAALVEAHFIKEEGQVFPKADAAIAGVEERAILMGFEIGTHPTRPLTHGGPFRL